MSLKIRRLFKNICLALLWLGIITAMAPTANAACECKKDDIQKAAIRAGAIFEGKAIAPRPYGNNKQLWQFSVTRYWKGRVNHSIGIVTQTPTKANCGRYFKPGASYLVFAEFDPHGKLVDTRCSFTRSSEQAVSIAKALGHANDLDPLERVNLDIAPDTNFNNFFEYYFLGQSNEQTDASIWFKYGVPVLFIIISIGCLILLGLCLRVFVTYIVKQKD